MAIAIKEWYPNGVTCLQVYREFKNSYFGAINGVEYMETWSKDENVTEELLQICYDELFTDEDDDFTDEDDDFFTNDEILK